MDLGSSHLIIAHRKYSNAKTTSDSEPQDSCPCPITLSVSNAVKSVGYGWTICQDSGETVKRTMIMAHGGVPIFVLALRVTPG